jgi:hypothetical protein
MRDADAQWHNGSESDTDLQLALESRQVCMCPGAGCRVEATESTSNDLHALVMGPGLRLEMSGDGFAGREEGGDHSRNPCPACPEGMMQQ